MGINEKIRLAEKIVWESFNILRDTEDSSEYVPFIAWVLFLKSLDEDPQLDGLIQPPYRWQDWAYQVHSGRQNNVIDFINKELLPYLRTLGRQYPYQFVPQAISEVFSYTEALRPTANVFRRLIELINSIKYHEIDIPLVFELLIQDTINYEKPHRKVTGSYFTPPELIQAMVIKVAPKSEETIYDPACGTGHLLVAAHKYLNDQYPSTYKRDNTQIHARLFGRELNRTTYLLSLIALILNGVYLADIELGDSLKENHSPNTQKYDVILTNPPFGKPIISVDQRDFPLEILFLKHAMENLNDGGRCGIILPTKHLEHPAKPIVKIREQLFEEFKILDIVNLPNEALFGVNCSILFFQRGTPTTSVPLYDLTDLHIEPSIPISINAFQDFLLPPQERTNDPRTWIVNLEEVSETENEGLKLSNPHSSYLHSPSNESNTYEIFISYRRDDTSMAAGRIYDDLARQFGAKRIFRDRDSIGYGENFERKIFLGLNGCKCFLAVIGQKWLSILHERLQVEGKDWVILEIETALKQTQTQVIPILTGEPKPPPMPPANDLPAEIQSLSKRRAILLSDEDFRLKMEELRAILIENGILPLQ